jgi:hypothetical protein
LADFIHVIFSRWQGASSPLQAWEK